jgi:hypothetical protein
MSGGIEARRGPSSGAADGVDAFNPANSTLPSVARLLFAAFRRAPRYSIAGASAPPLPEIASAPYLSPLDPRRRT